MDMSIISSLCAIFLPFIYGIYLLVSRFKLSYVNKKVLNYGTFFSNLAALTVFVVLLALIFQETTIQTLNFNIFNFDKINLDFGFMVNKENIIYLVFSSFFYTILALYSKFYFDKKKQFLFTKQRFYIFLSILATNTYLFLFPLIYSKRFCFGFWKEL